MVPSSGQKQARDGVNLVNNLVKGWSLFKKHFGQGALDQGGGTFR